MTDINALYDYFGLDLGDGETAVAWLKQGSTVPPAMLEVRGTKNILTALGSDHQGRYFIGEEAYQISDLSRLHLRFKSRFLLKPQEASECVESFARTLLSHLQNEKRIGSMDTAKFYVGCPSGWSAADRERYALLFERAGYRNVKMVSESRAAFLYSRESGQLHISGEVLDRPSLIIDAGSSTTDYTYVSQMSEKQLQDSGEVMLGAGIIDQMLWQTNLKMQRDSEKLTKLLTQYPQWNTRCEMEARRVKERYFNAQNNGYTHMANIESSVRLYCTNPATHVDIVCNDAMMKSILNAPVPELKGSSYLQAYRRSLLGILKALTGGLPHIILMTGGASRMRFMREIASEVFPESTLVYGNEPEFAIARGLCYALRMEEGASGFYQAVDDLIQSKKINQIVENELKPLFSLLSAPIVEAVIQYVAKPALAQWKEGQIRTLNGISNQMMLQSEEFLKSDGMKEILQPYVAQWLDGLRSQMEMLTNPICDMYNLPRTSLRLPGLAMLPGGIKMGDYKVISFSQIKLILDVIIASVVAVLAGGAETALLAAGPVGLVIGFVIGLVVAFVGTKMAEQYVMDADIPKAIRKLIPMKIFYKQLDNKQAELSKKTYAHLAAEADKHSPAIADMTASVASSIKQQLTAEMEKAILLIR